MVEHEEIDSNINLKDIKSSYIIKEVFSFLEEKQKLNMIIYNKELQKMLLVDLEDYKKISRKYKIGERNGKGKEYKIDNDELIFEGEYLNGKRNGKGKEYYYDGKIAFEGEYINGEMWDGKCYDKKENIIYELKQGKGFIKLYKYNILIFEGNYKNGKKNGKGKEYHFDSGRLIYEGEYINEEKNGKGKEYDYTGNLTFDGKYLYDKKIKGKQYVGGKLEYEGEFLYDKKYNGKGYDKNGNIIYELNKFLNGKRNGKGKE